MTAPDDPRRLWFDSGGTDYRVLPEPVALEQTIALHPVEPAAPPPDWSAGLTVLGDGGDGDGGGD